MSPAARAMLGLLIAAAVVGAVWWTGYSSREALVEAQRNGCERGILDRRANARAWRAAQQAREATARNPDEPVSVQRDAARTARIYRRTVDSLIRRARINCELVYPSPRVIEFR